MSVVSHEPRLWIADCNVGGQHQEHSKSDDEKLANSLLISAAPELLEELKDFHNHTMDQGFHDCVGIPGGCPVEIIIAKAEGR